MARAVGILLAALCLVGFAQATTWYISPYGNQNNNGTTPQEPFLTLSAALDVASTGDTIEAANGVYSGSDNIGLLFAFDVTLQGKSEGSTIFQSTNDDDEDLFKVVGAEVQFSQLTVVGASDTSATGVSVDSGGGFTAQQTTFSSLYYAIVYSPFATTASVSDCTFSSSVTTGVQVASTSTATVTLPSMSLTDSVFQSRYGLWVDMYSSGESEWQDLTVSGCQFDKSSLVVKDGEGPQSVTVSDSEFSGLVTTSGYPAVYVYSQVAQLTLSGVSVTHTTTTSKAAVYVVNSSSSFRGSLTVADSWVAFNDAGPSYPAGMQVRGYDVTVTDSGFVANEGPALAVDPYYSSTAGVTISNSVFFGNDATTSAATAAVSLKDMPVASSISGCYFIQNRGSEGGALAVSDMVVDVSGSYFYENEATAHGGAIYIQYSANATVSYSSFGGNTAADGGAAAALSGAGLSLKSTSFSDNSATTNGGGIYVVGEARLTALLCSFSGNSAENGGGWYSDASPVNGEMLLIRGNNATLSGGGFACNGNGVSILNGWISNNKATTGPAYSCASGCNTYLTHVYVASNNGNSGCGNDFVTHPLAEVEAAVTRELSALPDLDMEYILALVEENTSA